MKNVRHIERSIGHGAAIRSTGTESPSLDTFYRLHALPLCLIQARDVRYLI